MLLLSVYSNDVLSYRSENATYYALRVSPACGRVQVAATFTELLQPQPPAIAQKERQFVYLASESHYYYSL